MVLLLAWAGLGGCAQMGYYLQAAKGQYQILADREPVARLLASSDTPEALRHRLDLADRVRRFAIERLGLQGTRTFTQYTDIGRRYVVWNVVAAPAYDLAPKTWCFPIAGCVAYKGYFDEIDAHAEGDTLRAEGLDVIVYGVKAYSTLGWFADPLLNTYIHDPESALIAIIFHELAHQLVYVQNDSAFNEAFATAVETALLTDWLTLHGDPNEVSVLMERRRRREAIIEMILSYRERLAEAYRRPNRAALKPALFAQMQQAYDDRAARGEGTPYFDWWFRRSLNNADLLSVATYHRLVPAFKALLHQANGDYLVFVTEVKRLAALPAAERSAALSRIRSDERGRAGTP